MTIRRSFWDHVGIILRIRSAKIWKTIAVFGADLIRSPAIADLEQIVVASV